MIEEKNVVKENAGSFDFMATVLGCLMFILNVLLKPVSTVKAKIKNFSNVKNTGILLGVVSLGRMIIGLLSSMISVIFVKKVNYFSGDTKLEVAFDNLKELNYFDLTIKAFFSYVIVMLALAGIYYIVAMVMKKSANYFKLVAISSVAFVPTILAGLVSVIFAYIYAPLAVFVVCAAAFYSFLTFVNAMDDELDIDDSNLKVYFHTICFTVVIIVTFYVTKESLDTSLTSFLK